MAKIKRSLAIVIGINEYSNIPQLKNAVSDAQELADVLEEKYSYKVLLLLNEEASKEKLDQLLASLEKRTIPFKSEELRVEQSDRLLFYFAGHAFAEEIENNEEGKPAGYFMPQDAEDGNPSTWLSMEKVYQAFTNLDCHHLLMILDCCFAGRISWVVKGRNAARPRKLYQQSYDRFIKHRTEQIITSAAHDEEAQDSYRFGRRGGKNGHSPFAHLLLKVLKGNSDGDRDKFIEAILEDKVITVHELFTYLQNQLGEVAEGQTPALSQPRKYDHQTGEYVFFKGEYIFPNPSFNPQDLIPLKLDKNTNPYQGLASFESEDSQLFFGRKRLIEEPKEGLIAKVSNHRLTVVLGLSGSGKSSLVKAGLIPVIKPEEEEWYVFNPMRPGESPLTAMAKAIQPITNIPFDSLSKKLQQDSQLLTTILKQWSQNKPNLKLLLTIDQSEELITLSRNEQDREKFLQLLQEALATPELSETLRVLLILRSEFEPQIRDLNKDKYEEADWQKAWQKLWQNGRFFVTPMNREELQQVIEEPAAQRTLFFESPKLVNDLIDEVVQMPGALPLLSFTLSELYLKYLRAEENGDRNDRTITEADYREIGGVTRSLTETADKTYKKLIEKEKVDSSTIRDVMLRMVAISGGELARRRVPISELVYPEPKNKQVQKVIKAFFEERLLVKGLDVEGREYVEPVHDALITGWTKIKNWLDEKQETFEKVSRWNQIKKFFNVNDSKSKNDRSEAEKPLKVNLPLQREVATAAFKYKDASNKQQKKVLDWLWDDDPRLPLAEQVYRSTDNWLNQVEADFVRRSVKRQKFKTRRNWTIAISVILGLSGLTITALYQAQLSSLREKAASVTSTLVNDEPINGLVLAIAATGQNRFWLPWNIISPVQSSLHNALDKAKESQRFTIKGQDITAAAFSPDGKFIATGDGFTPVGTPGEKQIDGTIWLRDIQGRAIGKPISGIKGRAEYIIFSSDSKYIAVWDVESVKVLDLQGNLIKTKSLPFEIAPDTVITADIDNNTISLKRSWSDDELKALSSNEQYLAKIEGNNNEIITLWYNLNKENLDSQEPLLSFKGSQLPLMAISFSRDNRSIIGICSDNTIRVWDLGDNSFLEKSEYGTSVSAMVFTPDNKKIIISDSDNNDNHQSVNIWNLNGQKIKFFKTELNYIHSIAVSPNGQNIIFTDGSKIQLMNINGDQIDKAFEGHGHIIESVAFSPDNKYIISGSFDTTIRLWNLKGENEKTIELAFEGLSAKEPFKIEGEIWSVKSVIFSPDNKYIIAGISTDEHHIGGVIQLLDLKGNPVSKPFGKNWRFALSPNGKYIAITDLNNTIQLWDIKGNRVGSLFRGHERSIESLAFSPDSRFIASVSYDNTIRIWDTQGNLIRTFISNQGYSEFIAFSSDSRYIATITYDDNYKHKPLKLWAGNWQSMLISACHRLKDHPVLIDPKSDIEKSAAKACLRWGLQ